MFGTRTTESETLSRRQNAIARRHSEDILDRLTVPINSRQSAVLTEQQASAGRILRMHHADAQVSIKTTFSALDDRVDVSGGPSWGPPGGGGSELSQRWLRLMEKTLCGTDREIVMAIAVRRMEPRHVYEAMEGRGFMLRRNEVYTHIRRAFEELRKFCDGA